MDLETKYKHACNKVSAINEHLPILYTYAKECSHITEMGVAGIISSYAFLYAKPQKVVSYDLIKESSIDEIINLASSEGVVWEFIQKDVLSVDIEPTDLLFIDTYHIYDQLKKELQAHANKAKKYIILHDTTTFGIKGEPRQGWYLKHADQRGLWPAVEEFLQQNNEWRIDIKLENNNGLTVLKRIEND